MAVLNDRRKTPRETTRRNAPRLLINRNAQLYLQSAAPASGSAEPPRLLFGYTYDLSATGLSITLPALDCSVQELFDMEESLEVVLATTPELIRVKARPVHCETTGEMMIMESACIGLLITEQDNGYGKYLEYLRELQSSLLSIDAQ